MKQPAVILGELMENSRRRRAWLHELRPAADGIGKMIENPILWIHSFAGILGTNNEMLVYTYWNAICEYVTAAIVPHRGQLSTHTHSTCRNSLGYARRDAIKAASMYYGKPPPATQRQPTTPLCCLCGYCGGRWTKRSRRTNAN